MEKEFTHGEMGGDTRVNTSLIKNMALEFICGLMGEGMRVIGNTDNRMAMENITCQTAR